MTILKVLPLNRELVLGKDESIMIALQNAGIGINGACNGKGICGKCKIRMEKPEDFPEEGHEKLTREEIREGVRLACRVVPESDTTITLPDDFSLDARILEGEQISGARVNPAVRVHSENGNFQLEYNNGSMDTEPLENWEASFTPKGLAIDIGTTTVVVTLMNLYTGEELATASIVNPQTRFGHDVLTRIQMGSEPEGLEKLAGTLYGALSDLVSQVCKKSGSDPMEILDAVVGANTTMLQLAAKINPEPLGKVPFEVSIQGGQSYAAHRFGLNINPRARIYVPPVAHAFVGSDISAGLLSSGFFEKKHAALFIDIGTNGEMAINAGGQWIVTSTAAGPAFEGMGVSSGMRATAGAIEKVKINAHEGGIDIVTIGNAPARGICGSGIIDAMACIVNLELVDRSGRMKDRSMAEHLPSAVVNLLEDVDEKPAVRLDDNGVFFTQQDVRQLQLAKSAVRTGISMLLEETGTPLDSLGELILAGAFGYHLRPESLETIGLIPSGLDGRVSFAGNTSKTGSALMLLDVDLRRELEGRMEQVSYLSIAEGAEFQELFLKNIAF
jgi:uncharacterized 2Fe-2S/4Fe-4S cluster protein (DUF4445 family)